MPADENDAAIVCSVISLGHRLGVYVVADGVETEAQQAFLCAWGCDVIQGYLYKPALAAGRGRDIAAFRRRLPPTARAQ